MAPRQGSPKTVDLTQNGGFFNRIRRSNYQVAQPSVRLGPVLSQPCIFAANPEHFGREGNKAHAVSQ